MRQIFWSPIAGCTKVTSGCDNCCPFVTDHPCFRSPDTYGLDEITSNGEWSGVVKVVEHEFKRPFAIPHDGAVIWTAQMGDLFHPEVSDEVRARVFGVIARLPQHLFVLTTKRVDAMIRWLNDPARSDEIAAASAEWDKMRNAGPVQTAWPLPNLCVGASVEDQPSVDASMPLLMQGQAAMRLAWVAPILGSVDLSPWPGLDWIVCRGEEGQPRRPPDAQWVTALRDFAVANEIPFHFRGMGDGEMMIDGVAWKQRPSLG